MKTRYTTHIFVDKMVNIEKVDHGYILFTSTQENREDAVVASSYAFSTSKELVAFLSNFFEVEKEVIR